MTCPAGRVNTSDHPVTAEPPLLVIVMFEVRPVFQDWIVSVTAQPPGGGGGGELVVGGGEIGVVGGGVVFSPKKRIASAAIPAIGRLCPTPAMLYASTGGCELVLPYLVCVQLACGVSVDTGVWLTPSTFVHCLISSPKFGYASVVSAVPCQSCIRGRAPVYPGSAPRARSPHCCGV